jgi:hypothetical protein
VPDGVVQYIAKHDLYAAPPPSATTRTNTSKDTA